MNSGRSATTSFGLYELFRILVPGFYFAALTLFLYRAYLVQFLPAMLSPGTLALAFVFLVIAAGLTLYAKESTKRRKAFQENQPSRYLSDKARTMQDFPLLDEDNARRIYFYILNNHVPAAFYEKVFFFGTVYHIMIQLRRTSFWFALVSVACLVIEFSRGFDVTTQQGLVVFAVGVWILYLLNVRYNKADRKMQENYQDQIFWLEMHNDLVEEVLRQHHRFSSRRPAP
jgi:membrane protein implicated in regulation of membrane protease activity